MKPSDINTLMGDKALFICQELLPNGKKNANEWTVGSVDGELGKSMQVNLLGNGWIDFATGESGDYLGLWEKVRCLTFVETLQQVKAFLNITDNEEWKKRKVFQRPTKPRNLRSAKTAKSPVIEYLLGRGLSEKTIEDYKIAQGNVRGEIAIAFPYLRDNELVQLKQIALARPDGKKQMMVEKNCEPCLFGWQAISQDRFPFVIITEGEIDAMSWHEYGLPALSVPFGGGSGAKQDWIAYEYENLARFETIFIAMDNDDVGKLGADEIAQRLGLERCRIIKLPHKDINDCLMAKIDEEEIDKCLSDAKFIQIDEIKAPSEFLDQVVDRMHGNSTLRGFDSPWGKVNEKFQFGYGELTIINGVNGHGKSDLADHIAIHAASNDITCFIASMELLPHILLERMLKQVTSNPKPSIPYIEHSLNWMDDKVWLYNKHKSLSADKLIDVMYYAAKRYNVKLFLIDSLMKCGIREDDYNGQKDFVDKLCDFKAETKSHVLLVTHSRKGDNEEKPTGKMDVKGAGAITDLADNLFVVWRNKLRESALEKTSKGLELTDKETKNLNYPGVFLKLLKNRNGGKEGTFGLFFEERSHQFLEYEKKIPTRYCNFSELKAVSNDN